LKCPKMVGSRTLTVSVQSGRIINLEGHVNTDLIEVPAMVELRPVVSEKRSRRFELPKCVGGAPVTVGSAKSLAGEAMVGLQNARAELEQFLT